MERTNRAGERSEIPPDYLEIQAPDGVILDKALVQRDEPLALHNTETLEEDDEFLSVGSETWDYEVAEGRDREFLEAVRNSQMVMECVPLEDSGLIAEGG
jgi:hypothetical protein